MYFRVLALALSSDRVASGSSDKTVRIWCIYTGNLQQTFYGHQRGVWCVRFFTQKIVISGSYDTTIRVSIQNKLLKKKRKEGRNGETEFSFLCSRFIMDITPIELHKSPSLFSALSNTINSLPSFFVPLLSTNINSCTVVVCLGKIKEIILTKFWEYINYLPMKKNKYETKLASTYIRMGRNDYCPVLTCVGTRQYNPADVLPCTKMSID